MAASLQQTRDAALRRCLRSELLLGGIFLLLTAGAFYILGHHEPSAFIGALELNLIHKRSDYL